MSATDPPHLTIAEIASRIPDALLAGDSSLTVNRFVHPLEWRSPDDLTLILGESALAVIDAGARCAIISKQIADSNPAQIAHLGAAIVIPRPRHALALVTPLFPRSPAADPPPGIHPSAVVEDGAEIGEGSAIGPLAFIGHMAKLGRGCIIHPHASVAAGSVLGDHCILKPGARVSDSVTLGNRVILNENAVVGSDGFAFVTPEKGAEESVKSGQFGSLSHADQAILRIDSLGSVIIGDDVEIGACSTVDRATLGTTVVRSGSKIDNLVQIAHNAEIGQNCFICAQVGIAGSSKVGSRAILAGQVGVADHMTIGDDAVVMGGSAVTKNLEPGGVYFGFPAQPAKKELRNRALTNRLGEMAKELRDLRGRIAALESASP